MSQIDDTQSGTPAGRGPDGEATRETLSTGRSVAVVTCLILMVEVTGLTYTMVAPALSGIAATYRTPDVAWVITAVTLVGAVAFAVCGKLGDIFGKKKVSLACLLIFALGSVVSAVAGSFALLVAGRAMQGVGIAILVLIYGLVRDLLPASVIPVALGFVGTGMGASTVLGPFIGGVLIENFTFRGVFWFQVLYSVVIATAALLFVPETRLRTPARLDWTGSLILGGGALALLTGIGNAGSSGWTAPLTLGGIVAGLALLAAWFGYQRRVPQPLIDVKVLRERGVSLTLAASFCVQFVLVGNSMLIPLFVMTPTESGYGFGATELDVAKFIATSGVTAMIAGPLAGYAARRVGPRNTLALGGAMIALGSLMLAFGRGSQVSVMLEMAVFGIGIGTCTAALPNLIVRSVPADVQGVSGGMLNLMGSLGSSIGSQLLVVVLLIPAATYVGDRVVYGESGFTIAFVIEAVGGALAVLCALGMRSRTSQAAPTESA